MAEKSKRQLLKSISRALTEIEWRLDHISETALAQIDGPALAEIDRIVRHAEQLAVEVSCEAVSLRIAAEAAIGKDGYRA